MNWGYRIVIVYLLFVAGIVSLAVMSFQQTLDLETENYYEAEKMQDERMHQRELGSTYKRLIKINQDNEAVQFILPSDIYEKPGLKGEIRFLRPSDASLDKNFPFENSANGEISIAKNDLKFGFWKYAIEWEHAFGHYLIEDTLTLF
ncbi:MAG: FixH family protein [Flavobacteriales bacterium]|nr:FixH family protein [Flavobacteriales bacterium]